jgi:hypothetical protein
MFIIRKPRSRSYTIDLIDLILRLSVNSYKDLLNFSGQENLSGQKP